MEHLVRGLGGWGNKGQTPVCRCGPRKGRPRFTEGLLPSPCFLWPLPKLQKTMSSHPVDP